MGFKLEKEDISKIKNLVSGFIDKNIETRFKKLNIPSMNEIEGTVYNVASKYTKKYDKEIKLLKTKYEKEITTVKSLIEDLVEVKNKVLETKLSKLNELKNKLKPKKESKTKNSKTRNAKKKK